MTDDRIPRNEAIEIVGRELFGEAWVGELTMAEWDLIQAHKSRFADNKRAPAEIADQLYQAEERAARSDRQHGHVIRWLEDRGLDCVRGIANGLARKTFEAAFAAAFGRVLTVHAKTKFRDPEDAKRVRKGITLLLEGRATNPYAAAKQVAGRKAPEQLVDRLRKQIAKKWRAAKSPEIANHSQ